MGLCLIAGAFAQAAVNVSNLNIAQREGSRLVEMVYDVSSDVTNRVSVGVTVSNGTVAVNATAFSGDFGPGVETGTSRQIVWDMGMDWAGQASPDLLFTLSADDGETHSASYPCPPAKTGQTQIYRAGDDGELQKGVSWPSPRFIDRGNGTVSDTLTGLMWLKNANPCGEKNWRGAVDYCVGFSYGGHSDWRLPSTLELASLLSFSESRPALPRGHPFSRVKKDQYGYCGNYWTGTTWPIASDMAWRTGLTDGDCNTYMISEQGYVWPVRTETTSAPAPVRKTGQTTVYRTGDDGDLQPGVAWPIERFVDHNDGTVTDLLTGLMWLKDGGSSSLLNWADAVDYCENLTTNGYSDWHLPNINEIGSLIHYGKGSWGSGNWGHYPYLWLNSSQTPFSGVQNASYWSSTTWRYSSYTPYAWQAFMGGGGIGKNNKTTRYGYAWPVRSIRPGSSSQTAPADSRNYTLSVAAAHGITQPAVGNHTYAWRSAVTCSVEAVASDGWLFMGWSGDASTQYPETNAIVVMDSLSKSVVALFSDDADSDGLSNSNEWDLGTNPRNIDSDGDGFDDHFELTQGLSPTNNNSAISTYIENHGSIFGLYPSNVVLDVSLGRLLLECSGGTAQLQLQLEQSEELSTWTNAGAPIEWSLPVSETKQFFRVRSAP